MTTLWYESDAAHAASAKGDYGTLLRLARRAAGLNQRETGKILGCSHVSVSRYENGQQRLTDVTLLRLVSNRMGIPAPLLGLSGRPDPLSGIVDTNRDQKEADPMQRRHVLTGLAASAVVLPPLRAAASAMIVGLDKVLFSPSTTGVQPLPIARLAALGETARADFTACRFRELATKLPQLINIAVVSRDDAAYDERGRFESALSDLYALGNELAIKLHEHEAAWVLADRATQTAVASGDPWTLARAQWVTTMALRRSKHKDMAEKVITEGAQRFRDATGLQTPRDAGFYTRMLCCAAYTAAIAGKRTNAYDLLAQARDVTREHPRATFGIDNINIYGISVARAVGDFGQAVDFSQSIRLGQLHTIERQTRYWEDTAIAWWGRGRPVETYRALLAAERIAPQEVRFRPWAHRLTVNLLSCRPESGLAGIRDFAVRVGVGT